MTRNNPSKCFDYIIILRSKPNFTFFGRIVILQRKSFGNAKLIRKRCKALKRAAYSYWKKKIENGFALLVLVFPWDEIKKDTTNWGKSVAESG